MKIDHKKLEEFGITIERDRTKDVIPDYDNSNWLGKKQPQQGELGL